MLFSGLKIMRRARSQPSPAQAVVKRVIPRQKSNPSRSRPRAFVRAQLPGGPRRAAVDPPWA